jgi:hypothetical protein
MEKLWKRPPKQLCPPPWYPPPTVEQLRKRVGKKAPRRATAAALFICKNLTQRTRRTAKGAKKNLFFALFASFAIFA